MTLDLSALRALLLALESALKDDARRDPEDRRRLRGLVARCEGVRAEIGRELER